MIPHSTEAGFAVISLTAETVMGLADTVAATMLTLPLLMDKTHLAATLYGIWVVVSGHKRFKCSFPVIMPLREFAMTLSL